MDAATAHGGVVSGDEVGGQGREGGRVRNRKWGEGCRPGGEENRHSQRAKTKQTK